MKYLLSILLIAFTTFQFSTSIICLVENCNKTNIGILCQVEDEENPEKKVETQKQKSEYMLLTNFFSQIIFNKKSKKISKYYLIADYKTFNTTTILPPENF